VTNVDLDAFDFITVDFNDDDAIIKDLMRRGDVILFEFEPGGVMTIDEALAKMHRLCGTLQ
jgi:hypothetical protein